MVSGLSRLKAVSRNGLFVAGLLVATSSSANALTFNDINPIYNSNANEIPFNITTPAAPASLGYFFEAESTQTLNALGFAAPITGSGDYTVTLWSYANGGLDPNLDYTVLSTATFNTACAGCILRDFFLWKEVAPVTLAKTSDNPDTGYVITAFGDFAPGQQSGFSGGTGTFDNLVTYDGGGYNVTGAFGYPIPFGDPADFPPPVTTYAFFNANASFASVPGPLPIFGAAAAFGWTRKLRRRIKISG